MDDDFHVAKLHAAYVDSVAGFLALPPVGSASQALQAIHSLRPDLVLLDVYLPDGSGLDLLGQLDVDTMILSAASDAVSLRDGLPSRRPGLSAEAVHGRVAVAAAAFLRPVPADPGPAGHAWTRTRWNGPSGR